MAYVSSNANRFYAAVESAYGQAAAITGTNRFAAAGVKLDQVSEVSRRSDKNGSRTYAGDRTMPRQATTFEVRSYLTSWTAGTAPGYGPLFQAALGDAPTRSSGLSVEATAGLTQIRTVGAHRLRVGSAVGFGGELRFVAGVIDEQTINLNAPFSVLPMSGSTLAQTVTYRVASRLPSVSLYDYWDPLTTVSRCVTGAAVDTMRISANGDFHGLTFSGPAANLLDTNGFVSGDGGLAAFPGEPSNAAFDYAIVPGHLGQMWMGSPASQFLTVVTASVEVRNNLTLRKQETGQRYPAAVTPGRREVTAKFTLLVEDDAQTTALYAAAKQGSALPIMLQLGQQGGQLMSVFMPRAAPSRPVFDDSQTRLQWTFANNLAQGGIDDEIFIGFA